MRSLTLFLICCALASPANAATRFVVAVGARVGLENEDPLHYAHTDAKRFADTFIELGATAPARSTVLIDGGVHALELALARLQGQVEEAVRQGERVEVFFYASGHGDASSLHIEGERFPLATLHQRLKEMPAAITVMVLDACRTPVVTHGRDKGAVRGPAFDVTVQREVAPNGFVALYAARDGEAAQESDMLEGAYFTHHLLAGLRGAADFDGDKKVTLAEAWRHAHQTTLSRSHATAKAQHPEMHTALEGEAEMVLIDLVRAKATVVLPAPVAGELLVVDALSGRVLLDVHKAKGAPLSVALPARKMRMQLRPDDARGTVRIGEVDLTWGGAHTLNPQSLTEQPLLAMAEKGAHKDSTPWGAVVQIGPMMSPLGVWGGIDAAISRRAFDTPVFVRARVGALRSESEWTVDDVAWHYVHARAHAALGAEVELILWRVRFSAGADAGIAMVTQNGDRTDAARLKSLGYSIAPVSTLAIGPTMSLDAQVQFPIAWGLSLLGGARTGGVWVPIDDTPTLLPDAMFFVGAGMEW